MAERPSSCDNVLKACDAAVSALEKERTELQTLLVLQKDATEGERAEKERVRRAYDNRIPAYVWIGGGLLVGAAGALYLTK